MKINPATEKQLSFLRKLYYKSDLLPYESYDMFDDYHTDLIDRAEASKLISFAKEQYRQNNEMQTKITSDIIEKIADRIDEDGNKNS